MRHAGYMVGGLILALSLVSTRTTWAHRISGSVDKSLMKDPSDTLVYVEEVGGAEFSPPTEAAVVEQRGMQFLPRVLPVLRGTRVRFPNVDRVRHNVFSPSPTQPFTFGIYYPGQTRELVFDKIGVVSLLCNIHEEMSAYVVVLQNPYFSRVESTGRYVIDAVPDGKHTVVLWRERKPPVKRQVTVRAGNVDVTFGR
jgi:plastocyanin